MKGFVEGADRPQTTCLDDWVAESNPVRALDVFVDPLAYLSDVRTPIVNGYSNRDIDQLLPWAYRKQDLKAVA